MHNDLIVFLVERGLVGVLGLILFGVIAVNKPTQALLKYKKQPGQVGRAIILVAAVIAIFIQPQTY